MNRINQKITASGPAINWRLLVGLFVLPIVGCSTLPESGESSGLAIAVANVAERHVFHCAPLPVNQSKNDCEVSRQGTAGTIITGTVLGGSAVFVNGQVLVGVDGKIAEIGCEISADKVANTTLLSCPSTTISPGFINPHDHIRYTHQYPADWGDERFEHRHQWRLGLDGHNRVGYEPATNDEQVAWGELRQALAGTTSMAGEGGVPGLVRNLENPELNSELAGQAAFTTIFPLGDANGTRRDEDCDYPALADRNDFKSARSFQAHLAEGVDRTAANEIGCITGQHKDAIDVTDKPSAFVHFVGAYSEDAKFVQENGISIVWSPRSNIALYGQTADVSLLKTLGVNIALSTDWIYSGSMNMLRELQCASSYSSDYLNGRFSNFELWQMATENVAASFAYYEEIGSLRVDAHADLAIFEGVDSEDPYSAVLSARASDVVLVMRDGVPLAGNAKLIADLVADTAQCPTLPTALTCGKQVAVCLDESIVLQDLLNANTESYPLMSCASSPESEPTCTPRWPKRFDGIRIVGVDNDGDGVGNEADSCVDVFNPARPMDEGQPDADGDGLGDSCDDQPFGPN